MTDYNAFQVGLDIYKEMALKDPIIVAVQQQAKKAVSQFTATGIPKYPCDCLFPPEDSGWAYREMLQELGLWWPICFEPMTGEDLFCDGCRTSGGCVPFQVDRRRYKQEHGVDVPHLTHEQWRQANEMSFTNDRDGLLKFLISCTLEGSSTSS